MSVQRWQLWLKNGSGQIAHPFNQRIPSSKRARHLAIMAKDRKRRYGANSSTQLFNAAALGSYPAVRSRSPLPNVSGFC